MGSFEFKFGAIALASLVAATAAPSAAGAAVILSSSDGSSCAKAGCLETGSYQQTFSAADFSGGVSVGALKLDRRILGSLAGQTFRLSFSLGDGTELGSWGSWTMGGIGGDVWNIDGADFNWDTASGDLVMKIEILRPKAGGAAGGGFAGGGFGGGGGFSSLPIESGPGGGLGSGGGGDGGPAAIPPLNAGRIGDNFSNVVMSVPEPATWGLMIVGFGGAGVMLRRRARLALA